ncbi:hypothetical protein [Nocardia mexicana]|uniref:Deazaflavin-dependent oxidoreductase (Nitroreductase family) n=1 Tax=Nocardia mexicana TaxID=279262 RepID=A0A370H9N1_9NOCA|nr:hypothetical protein [Nocardia mexicana]RDI53361.1 hypothetical protein DFR68_103751 [Nocardia mexicana]
MSTRNDTPGFGAAATLVALRLPVGLRRRIGELRFQGWGSTLPVPYACSGGSVVVRVDHADRTTWWRTFRSPHPVSIRTGRSRLTGTGRVVMPGTSEYEMLKATYQRAHPRRQAWGSDPYVLIDVDRRSSLRGAAPATGRRRSAA